jgi:hypothetical protein
MNQVTANHVNLNQSESWPFDPEIMDAYLESLEQKLPSTDPWEAASIQRQLSGEVERSQRFVIQAPK